jgi:hypothetical protein
MTITQTQTDVSVGIGSPTENALILSSNITVTGIAKAEQTTTNPTDPDDVSLPTDVTQGIDSVKVKFGNGAFQEATTTGPSTKKWATWSFVGPTPSGVSSLTITAKVTMGTLTEEQSVNVRMDTTGPTIEIGSPQNGSIVVLNGAQTLVSMMGNVKDLESGVKKLEWLRDGLGAANAISPINASGNWSTSVPFTQAGEQTITVRATDNKDNVATKEVLVDVRAPSTSVDPEEVLGARAYLADLLQLALSRLNPALSPNLLASTLCQRYDALADPVASHTAKAAATEPVKHARVCAEVLREYLKKRLPSPPTVVQGIVSAGEREYARAAYEALLLRLGTSYDELRQARSGDEEARAVLAERLGFVALTPDLLDQLTLHPASITEDDLERVFGLTRTKRDPFPAQPTPVAEPLWLTLQCTGLQTLWQRQDHPDERPLVDPDVVGEDDVISASPAATLRASRHAFVQGQLAALRTLRDQTLSAQGATQATAFSAVVQNVLGSGAMAELTNLAADDENGADIAGRLADMHLELAAFRYLVHVRKLAAAGLVQENEWADVFSILVQVQKAGSNWREEERAQNLYLGPNFFKAAQSDPDAPGDALPEWRATLEDRLRFEDTLRARVHQEQALKDALAEAVGAAEDAALPLLRDRLIDAIARARVPDVTKPAPPSADVARLLGRELFVDFAADGAGTTSRLDQATDTLQGLLYAVRTGRLRQQPANPEQALPVLGSNPAVGSGGWKLATGYLDSMFDTEWRSRGTRASWRAAISVFHWPENLLLPSLRQDQTATNKTAPYQTAHFKALVGRVRANLSLTPTEARDEAATYLTALKADASVSLPPALKDSNFRITEQLTNEDLVKRRDKVLGMGMPSATDPNLFKDVASFASTPNWLAEVFYFVPMLLALQLEKSGQYLSAIDWIRTVYAHDLHQGDPRIYRGLALEPLPGTLTRDANWVLNGLNPHGVAANRTAPSYTRFTILTLARCLLGLADAEFARETRESLPKARLLYETAQDLLSVPEMTTPNKDAQNKLLPLSPLLEASRLHAGANLQKQRNGLNNLGLERAPSGRPTPYRYPVLVERATQLANTAQQMEAAFLAALEKRDAEAYNLLKANQDKEVSFATVELQGLRLAEANGGVTLAERQRERANIQARHFKGLVDQGATAWEHAGLFLSAAGSVLSSAVSGAKRAGGPGAVISAAAATVGAAGSIISGMSSFERRNEEWRLQLKLADQEVLIGDQQIALARMTVDIVTKEESIAKVQDTHAQATVDFLQDKFTNAELFEWMSGVLGGVYRYFLQQATTLARLAERQLRFERQEELPGFIRSDYWAPPGDETLAGNGAAPDRRGLTGSARLLEDITRLDQHAFTTDRRRLQLTRTVSLAALDPLAFQRFRETEVLRFQMPLSDYDREFPGHYLRLIKRIKTSVIALVPPNQGIRATLASAGASRVVVDNGGGVFETAVIGHGSEEVALSAPINATGLFELDAQPDLRTPFEGFGVDTMWELRMPKAANPFDFDTLFDVLFTVEYTALDSKSYREQVIRTLPPRLGAEQAFSFRDRFPDQWYDLHNPDQSDTPLTVRFRTDRADFAPNLEDLKVEHLVIYFVRADGQTFEVPVSHLRFRQGDAAPVPAPPGGRATSAGGLISTRRISGEGWRPIQDRSPFGEWELSLKSSNPDEEAAIKEDKEIRDRFENEEIEDILFVITYSGRTPAWPA